GRLSPEQTSPHHTEGCRLRLDGGGAVLHAHAPAPPEGRDAIEREALEPGRECVRGDPQRAGIWVRLEPELRTEQEQRGSGGPRLRPRRGGHDPRRLVPSPVAAGEELRQPVLEEGRAAEEGVHYALRRLTSTGRREAERNERVVMGPDGAVVVLERVERGFVRGERSDPPAGPERS